MIEPVLINNRLIGPGHAPYVIAEACINHEGDFDVAVEMVHVARALKADAIKFQIHCLDNEMLRVTPQSANFAEPLWDTLERTNLTLAEHRELMGLCGRLGIDYLCTPFSRDGADLLEESGVEAYKTGSGELTNLPLIEHIARKGKPMIVSTGMSTIEEIDETVELVRGLGTPLVLMHCVSAYPCPYRIVNLGLIPRYAQRYQLPVGLSDHSRGIYTALGAVALGACCLEKHFTLDKLQPGPDHASSIEPDELAELTRGARAVFDALGAERKIFAEEKPIVAWARESVVSETEIPQGATIEPGMVWVKRPGPADGAIPARDLALVVGRRAAVDIPRDTQIRYEQLA